ncbi:MAG: hypothetical protein RIR00_385 [Pseudomonadota bacterium]|jgi:CheY-like chemotaxis protein
MTASLNIFIVDDDPTARMLMGFLFDELGYAIKDFADGASCLKAVAANPDARPDIVLLDVEMPGMNGLEVCRQLRIDDDRVQIIFISAHDDVDTRLSAYDCGGNDFIVKPVLPEELSRKIQVAERALQAYQDLRRQADFARQAAFTAMSSMGEMGTIVEFIKDSFAASDAPSLVQSLFRALRQYELVGLVELRLPDGSLYLSTQGECTQLEREILSHARNLQRIFQFSNRLAINYNALTLLVPNLPVDDPDRVGRLRDHLAILAEIAEARIGAQISETWRLQQAQGVLAVASELGETLGEIETSQQQNRLRALESANGYLTGLERAFVQLGLTESQENTLVSMAQQAIEQIVAIQDDARRLDDRITQAANRLRNLVGNP